MQSYGALPPVSNNSTSRTGPASSPPPGYDTYAIPLHPQFSQSLLPTEDPYAMVTHPSYPTAVPHRLLVNWNGKPGELVFDNGRQWAVDLWSIASQERGRCLHAFCCAPCEVKQQRSLLQRPQEDYQCCFDGGENFCTCCGPCTCCGGWGGCCLNLEVCCCMPCSIRGVRRRMQSTRHLEHSWVPECGCGARRPANECCKPLSGHLMLGTANPCCIAIVGVCLAATLVGQCNLMYCALAQQGHELRLFPEGANPSPEGPRTQIMVENADAHPPNYKVTDNNPRSPSSSELAHWSVLLHPKLSRSTLPDENAPALSHPAYSTTAREKVLVDISPSKNVYVMDRGRKWLFDDLLRIPCAIPRQFAAALCCGPCEVKKQRSLLQRADEPYQCCMDCGSSTCTCCGPWTCGCCGGAFTDCCLCLEVCMCLSCATRGNRRRMQQSRQLSHSRVACCGCPRRRANECLTPPKVMAGSPDPCCQVFMLFALLASCFGGCGLVCCAIAQQSHELESHSDPRMGTEQHALVHSAAHRVVPNGPEAVRMG